ncbi:MULTISPECIES: hypothetical protein [Pseudomonas]|uniref:Uncharacterized protein n=1 Tax=Pseudomonas lutea TaxID=243924 RepID=A0A9X8QLQ6_9PSED|nr:MULTISPECIES: hypothetical protein [Pseudomonas]SER36539.1 hypothetical protein SAMN05216409_11856 [Pseudomonas lutea]
MTRKHQHYFHSVEHLSVIDVYRICEMYVDDPSGATQHAIKKLLLPGQRGGGKGRIKDLREAADTIKRRIEMLLEDEAAEAVIAAPMPDLDEALSAMLVAQQEDAVEAGQAVAPEGWERGDVLRLRIDVGVSAWKVGDELFVQRHSKGAACSYITVSNVLREPHALPPEGCHDFCFPSNCLALTQAFEWMRARN